MIFFRAEEQFFQKHVQIFERFPHRQRQDHERLFGTARIDLFYLASPLPLAWRLLPYGLSVTSLPVGQALSDDAFYGALGSFHVIYAKSDTIGIAEIKFRQITVQVLFLAVLISAFHAAFEDRVVALDRVRVNVAAHVFVFAVIDGVVARKFAADLAIVGCFIGHEGSFVRDVRLNDRRNVGNADAVHMKATGTSAALDKSQNGILVAPSSLVLRLVFDATDEGFVGLDDLASATHRIDSDDAHSLTDAVRHEPRGFESDAQGPVKLVAADALLGRAKQVHRLQPQVHRDVAILENGPDLHGELLAALVAFVEADPGRLAGHLPDAVKPAAMGTYRALGPYAGLNPRDSGSFALKDFGRQDRISHDTSFPYVIQGYPVPMGLSSIISPLGHENERRTIPRPSQGG